MSELLGFWPYLLALFVALLLGFFGLKAYINRGYDMVEDSYEGETWRIFVYCIRQGRHRISLEEKRKEGEVASFLLNNSPSNRADLASWLNTWTGKDAELFKGQINSAFPPTIYSVSDNMSA